MFSLSCVWIKAWVNSGEAGDLRRYRTHYDVTVMSSEIELLKVSEWLSNKDQQQYSLSLAFNSGTTDLTLRLGTHACKTIEFL